MNFLFRRKRGRKEKNVVMGVFHVASMQVPSFKLLVIFKLSACFFFSIFKVSMFGYCFLKLLLKTIGVF